jgi:peptidoglycan/LPS O-acetylase OafA/YrhL
MKLIYRPEIDGLRAIAISAVILYHAQITILGHQPFKGGFIGVDIFFVISGYLITSIILKELITTGSFSFKHFYERRLRRILPALLFVMLVSLPFAWMYLMPSNLIDFSKSILYSLGFSSNYYFWYSGHQYGAESEFLKPFLHTWSLSVEEQYYIIFPVVLLITFKYFRKYLIHILILGFVISLGLAEWTSRNFRSTSFYFLHTRMWELLAGSILAYFEIMGGGGIRFKYKIFNLILPSVGLFLIGHSILFFNDKMFHPSFYSLSPIIGVCLIIWFSHKDEIITKILSTKLFVGIGLISYSLYLWHYSIFTFDSITEFTQGSLFYKLFLVAIIVILTIVSYYFIEKPYRNKKYKFKVIISSILISISILIIVNINFIHKDGYKNRLPEILQKNLIEKPWNLLKNLDGVNCFENIEGCRFNTSFNKKVYIIGDSHMASLAHDLKVRVVKNNYQFITFITSIFGACLYDLSFNNIDIKTEKINEKCKNNYFQKLKQPILNDKNSIFIFGGRFPFYLDNFDNQGRENSFKSEVLEISKKHKVILVYPIPEMDWNVPSKLNIFFKKLPKNINKREIKISDYISSPFQNYKNRAKTSYDLLDSIKSENIYRVYPHKLFCDTIIKNMCATHDDKNIFYADNNHPSSKGAEMINDLIMKEIEKIELK